ncbi:Hypothetical predicted protein [Olea europaea subsp. europaea]|uniref:Uncharacterized protein n=1 Tax=Olea europaea subsp. europaea TaxID=158383 RepID=A0A8S0PFW3_OLEEU|nr:Hypothetical predicted protein [Olea europaea subsp. europaea]
MLQDEFNIQTTKCDNCIIRLSCIFSIIALLVGSEDIEEASQLLNCLSDMGLPLYSFKFYLRNLLYHGLHFVQTQHMIGMDKRDGMFGAPSVMAAPPVQQICRIDQPVPPQVGYPPPPPYGQPPTYPPPVYGMPPAYPPPPTVYGPHTGYPPPPPRYGHPPGYPSLPQPQAEGCPSPPQPRPKPQLQGYPPTTYPSQGYGYPPANYPSSPT